MAKKYKGSLSLEWFNKQKSIVNLNEDSIKSANDIPAPRINWINKEEALFYELNEEEGRGNTPYWVNRDDIRVKEARPLVFQKAYKAIEQDKTGTLPGTDTEYTIQEIDNEEDSLDIENMLIKGDNLLALNTLKKHFDKLPDNEKVKCIYIDPPFNTEQAFEHYDDNLAHSEWLTLMRDRLRVLRELMSSKGSIWITLDDAEVHYFKVLCDEVFGRSCFIGTVIWKTTDNSNNNATTFSEDHNQILVYGKNEDWKPKFLNYESKRSHFKNPDNDPKGPWFDGNPVNNPGLRPNLQYYITTPKGNRIKHPPNGWRWSKEKMDEKFSTGELRFNEDETRVIRRTYLKDMKGLPPSSLWVDLKETGHNRQAKYELKKLFPDLPVTSLFSTPKPEKLLKRVIELSTDEEDIVLDCFGGSGTTFATAHKMKRTWIGCELGDHADTFILPRLNKVLSGKDGLGLSESLSWQGGGSFKYYHLGESIISIDEETKKGEFNWSLGKQFIQESLLQSYDFVVQDINVFPAQIFQDEDNKPTVGKIVGSSNKAVYGLAFLATPQESNLTITNEEVKTIYSTLKKQSDFQSLVIYSNKGIDIAQDTIPEDLAIIKVPHAIFSELER